MNGVCAHSVDLEIENGVIKDVSVMGGCNGNLKGISALLIGSDAEAVANRLEGITCGGKPTSCQSNSHLSES